MYRSWLKSVEVYFQAKADSGAGVADKEMVLISSETHSQYLKPMLVILHD